MFVLAEASPSETAVEYLNEVYRLKVIGNDENLFVWTGVLIEENLNETYKSIILLNNTLSLGLELHMIEFSLIENSTSIDLISHLNPDFTKVLEPNEEAITTKFLKKISGHPHGTTLQSSRSQSITYKDKSYKISENIVSADKSTYKFYIVQNSTHETGTYYWQVSGVATKTSETDYTKLIISVVLTFVITCSLTVAGLVWYYKKHKSFPFLQMRDEQTRSLAQAKLQL